jgi:hypothetical protein
VKSHEDEIARLEESLRLGQQAMLAEMMATGRMSVTEARMRLITDPDLKQLLIKHICLGKVRA